LDDPNLLGGSLPGPSWRSWRILLIASMGEPLTEDERQVFTELTQRVQEPLERAEEFFAVIGRRGGKTEAVSTLGAFLAGCVDYSGVLVPGETGVLMIVAADQEQATIVLDRIEAKLRTSPIMKQLVQSRTQKHLRLSNGVLVMVRASNYRRVRGATLIGAIGDECAFWSTDEGAANPDTAICAALRPALATTGGPLFLISSPYAKRGELYTLYRKHFGPHGDPRIIVAQAPSRTMNPSLPQSVVDRAVERDAASAQAEYMAEFCSDVGQFVDRDVIMGCVMPGVRELMPARAITYKAFTDPSGGSSDSFTLCVAHHDGAQDVCIVDALREYVPPFSPEGVVAELAQLLKSYNVSRVTGDRYAGEWPRESFAKHGITYELSAMTKSQLYGALLPMLNSGRIDLPDNARLISQLASLERRTGRNSRDSIDHAQGGHDDVSNCVAGAAAITVATSGYSLETLMRACDIYDPVTAAEQALQRLAAAGGKRPLSGPLATGATSLGAGGYRAAGFNEAARAELEREGAEANRGRPPANVPPCDNPASDGFGHGRKDDRDGLRLPLDGNGRRGPECNDDVGLQANQVLHKRSYPIDVTAVPPNVHQHVAAIGPIQVRKRLRERREAKLLQGIVFVARHEHADAPQAVAPLRPRHQRPSRRASKPRDELPPSHP
jgi:hypothetical protein